MEFLIEIGNRLKMIRIMSGLKQNILAEKLSVQASLLSLYEQGKREPSLSFLNSFCKFFDMSLSQFFSFQESLSTSELDKKQSVLISGLEKILMNLEKVQFESKKKDLQQNQNDPTS